MELPEKKKPSKVRLALRGLSWLGLSALLLGAFLPPPDVPVPPSGRGGYICEYTVQPDIAALKEAVQRLSEQNNRLNWQLEFANGLKPFEGWVLL